MPKLRLTLGWTHVASMRIDHQKAKMTAEKTTGCRRSNHVHAAYVEAAIRLSTLINARHAEDMLRREGVSMKVIVRVLLQKGPHRVKLAVLESEEE